MPQIIFVYTFITEIYILFCSVMFYLATIYEHLHVGCACYWSSENTSVFIGCSLVSLGFLVVTSDVCCFVWSTFYCFLELRAIFIRYPCIVCLSILASVVYIMWESRLVIPWDRPDDGISDIGRLLGRDNLAGP